ncbi:uncharacterized protein ACA1_010940, partial [Acanthamoeba castellanii str. Neff]
QWRSLYGREWSATAAQARRYREEVRRKLAAGEKDDDDGEDEEDDYEADEEEAAVEEVNEVKELTEGVSAEEERTEGTKEKEEEESKVDEVYASRSAEHEEYKRDLPLVRGLTSWKQFFWLRRKLERSKEVEAILGADPHERTAAMYLAGGYHLYEKRPKVEDDPMQWNEDRDDLDTRMLYLNRRDMRAAYTGLGNVSIEFAVYQKHWPPNATIKAIEHSYLAGVIRTYGDSDIHTHEEAIAVFKSALELFPDQANRTEEENEECAYIMHEIATKLFEQDQPLEALEWYIKAIDEYELAIHEFSAPLLLSNMAALHQTRLSRAGADAIKEQAELIPALEAKLSLIDEAASIYAEAQELVALGDTDMCIQLIHGLAVVYLTRACFLDNHISADYDREPTEVLGERLAAWRKDLQESVAQAEQILNSTDSALNDPYTDFCFARIYAVSRRFDECRKWLEKCRHRRYLGKMRKLHRLAFKNVEDQAWFQRMVDEQTAASGSLCIPEDDPSDLPST